MPITTETVTVNPDTATKWLDTNHDNRNISSSRVQIYAEDMRKGRWLLNHQGLAFDESGELIDGQHRLWAVIEANVDVTFMVTRGLPRNVVTTIDAVRVRGVADQLRMVDGIRDSKRIVAAINAIPDLFSSHHVGMSSYGGVKEQLELYEKEIEWVRSYYTSKNTKLMKAPIMAAMIYAWATSPTKVDEFAKHYFEGSSLAEGDPALTLRNFVMLRMPGKRVESHELSVKTATCVKAHILGTKLRKLYGADEAVAYFKAAHTPKVKK